MLWSHWLIAAGICLILSPLATDCLISSLGTCKLWSSPFFLQGKLGVPGLPGYPGRQGPKVSRREELEERKKPCPNLSCPALRSDYFSTGFDRIPRAPRPHWRKRQTSEWNWERNRKYPLKETMRGFLQIKKMGEDMGREKIQQKGLHWKRKYANLFLKVPTAV